MPDSTSDSYAPTVVLHQPHPAAWTTSLIMLSVALFGTAFGVSAAFFKTSQHRKTAELANSLAANSRI